jgi:hypothetical protein
MKITWKTDKLGKFTFHHAHVGQRVVGQVVHSESGCGWQTWLPNYPKAASAGYTKGLRTAKIEVEEAIGEWFDGTGL